MFENGNYRRRKRRPKQIISTVQKPSSTSSSSIPLDESSLSSSSESNHHSLLTSSHHDDDDVNQTHNFEPCSFVKIEPTMCADVKKRRRSPTPDFNKNKTKKVKTVSAFSSIDALIAPSTESKSVEPSSISPCRYTNQHHPYLSSIPTQYLSLLTNGFALHNPAYNRHFPAK